MLVLWRITNLKKVINSTFTWEPEPDPEPETQLYAEPAENGPVPQHCMLFRLYMYVGLKVELFLMC